MCRGHAGRLPRSPEAVSVSRVAGIPSSSSSASRRDRSGFQVKRRRAPHGGIDCVGHRDDIVMLPEAQDLPTGRCESGVVATITLNICVQLGPPPCSIAQRVRCVFEGSDARSNRRRTQQSGTREHDVWPTSALGQHAGMFPIPETPSEKVDGKLLLQHAFLAGCSRPLIGERPLSSPLGGPMRSHLPRRSASLHSTIRVWAGSRTLPSRRERSRSHYNTHLSGAETRADVCLAKALIESSRRLR